MAQWDSQSDSGMDVTESTDFDLSMDSDVGREITNSSTPASESKAPKQRSENGNLRKTSTGLPHNPQAPPSQGTGPTGDPLISDDSPTTVPHVHTDFYNDFGELFDDDDLE